MSMIVNNALGHFMMCSTVWCQLISIFRKYKRLLPLVSLIAGHSVAQSESQPAWIADLSQVVITGVQGDSLVYGELIRDLTLEAAAITGLPLPMQLPPVILADQDTVARYACQGKCEALGAFHPTYGIAIVRHLDPLKNDLTRSILLHELVHFLQHENKLFAGVNDCIRWLKREAHAYAAQNKFLRKVQSTTRVANSLTPSCRMGRS